MSWSLVNPADPVERQNEKLLRIADALMRRVEQATDDSGAAYAQFQRAAILEDEVSARTRDLEKALDLLNESNARLAAANRETEGARQNLANALEAVQEGFALFDPDDVLVMCNSRFGLHMADLRPALSPGLRFDEYIARVSASPYLVLATGETRTDWALRRMQRHRDHHVMLNVQLAGNRQMQVSEHRTPDGGTVILQTDVTELVRLERLERGKLIDEQARMIRATLDHLNQGIAIFDDTHQLVGWNQRLADLMTLPAGLLRIGARFSYVEAAFAATAGSPAGEASDPLAGWVARPGARRPLSYEHRHANGSVLDVFAQEMPGGGFVISFTDVTPEREATSALTQAKATLEARVIARTHDLEDALARAERASASRSRFVAAASHDLLQPLSAAKLFLASLDDGADPATNRSTVEKAQNALLSVEQILAALLDISRLESGPGAVQSVPVRLHRILGQLADEFTPLARAKGLRLCIRPGSALVISDPTYLRRILQNLIGNAIRYTERGGVLVGARRQKGGLRIEVWDTGPGIPEAEQENIFKEFHRLNARASASEGMGLGLAIVERACALLGHPLALWSVPGRGTRFSVSVARAPDTPVALRRPDRS